MSIAEILDRPAVVPLWPIVGRPLLLAESTTYQLAAENRLPVEVIRLKRRRVARTVDLHRFLGLLPEENGAAPTYQAGASAGNDEGGPGTGRTASVEQIRTYREVRDRNSSMHRIAQTSTSTATQRLDRESVHAAETPAARDARIEDAVDRILAELAKPTPTEQLHAVLSEHGIQLIEWDPSGLPEDLRDGFYAFYIETAGRKTIVVPTGQAPAHRLAAVRVLLTHQGVLA
ncbi:hypothetical protein N8I84_35255 [Streptomyces cynarae]|uniref:Uncharacterized protein n=1 Tax=Streptomyces cynarae TaxID=2981134 RepID=A0ABY6EBV2_9ACTN|nr:hypothetical protein [Streptomyces cynarae]UXY23378.1 hypothetical protein N8I84_35255 [Streptomyces cynarae]